MKKPKIYLIHPVREITPEIRERLDKYVANIESQGKKVHYPIRDVDQDNDPTGSRILTEHRDAMRVVEEVHDYYFAESSGSMFDLGMGFAGRKPLFLINPEDFIGDGREIEEFAESYATNSRYRNTDVLGKFSQMREELETKGEFTGFAYEKTPEFLFVFGMAFYHGFPIIPNNLNSIEQKPHKCFENVILELNGRLE